MQEHELLKQFKKWSGDLWLCPINLYQIMVLYNSVIPEVKNL